MASDDIRKIMNLLESVNAPEEMIDEGFAGFIAEGRFLNEGWLSNFKNKMKRKMGERELEKLSKRLNDEWHTWLGQVNRTGDLNDMERFMVMRVGFNDKDVKAVLNDPNSPVANRLQDTSNEPEDDADDGDAPIKQTIKTGSELNSLDDKAGTEPEPEKTKEPTTPAEPDAPAPEEPKKDDAGFSDAIRAAQAKAKAKRTGEPTNTKIEPTSEPADTKKEPGEVVGDPADFMGAGGKLDPKKINDKLRSMPIGDKLTLGKRTFFLGPKDEKPKTESFNEADGETATADKPTSKSEPEKPAVGEEVLSGEEVEEILHLAASHINDQYLLNGPENDAYYDQRDRTNFAAQRNVGGGGSNRQGGTIASNSGGTTPSGQYDSKELWDVLAQNGFTKARFKTLEQKVANSKSVGDMSNEDMRQIAMIGYALLRSRT